MVTFLILFKLAKVFVDLESSIRTSLKNFDLVYLYGIKMNK